MFYDIEDVSENDQNTAVIEASLQRFSDSVSML